MRRWTCARVHGLMRQTCTRVHVLSIKPQRNCSDSKEKTNGFCSTWSTCQVAGNVVAWPGNAFHRRSGRSMRKLEGLFLMIFIGYEGVPGAWGSLLMWGDAVIVPGVVRFGAWGAAHLFLSASATLALEGHRSRSPDLSISRSH